MKLGILVVGAFTPTTPLALEAYHG